MLVQVINKQEEDVILFEVSNNYTLEDAEKILRNIIQKANDMVENSETDLYILDKIEEMLPHDIQRVYTETIICEIFM